MNFLLFFIFSLLGSFFNIPLGKARLVMVQRPYFFGLFKKQYAALQGVSINVGGALVPAVFAAYFLLQVPLKPALLGVFFMATISYFFAKVIPGQGVVISPFLVATIALVLAFLLNPYHAAPLAFASGVFGVLIGADLLNISKVLKEGGIISLGGAGVFDAIFLIGVFSALLSRL